MSTRTKDTWSESERAMGMFVAGLEKSTIARELCVTVNYVENLLRCRRQADDEVQRAWEARRVPYYFVSRIAALPPDVQRSRLMSELEARQSKRHWRGKEIEK